MKRTMLMLSIVIVVAAPAFATFSIDMPVVTHVQGATTVFYTSLDVSNHTAASTPVLFEYISSDLAVDATGTLAQLGPHGNFHADDVLTYLANNGFITAAQGASGFGTMLLTFTNQAFTTGNEASATARIY